jgi:hypothetical protein
MSADEAAKRIQELEEALRREKAKSEEYKAAAYAMLDQVFPFVPPTEEEIRKLQTETDGTPILEIIAELEKEFAE